MTIRKIIYKPANLADMKYRNYNRYAANDYKKYPEPVVEKSTETKKLTDEEREKSLALMEHLVAKLKGGTL